MTFQVTTIITLILAIMLLVLSVRVMQGRSDAKVSLGDGGDPTLIRRIRGMGNFVEYVPLALILLGLAEANGGSDWALWVCGVSLALGRLLHGYAFAFTDHNRFGRAGGIALTFAAYIGLIVLNGWLVAA